MERNRQIVVKQQIEKKKAQVREHLRKAIEIVEPSKEATYERTPFWCSQCDKSVGEERFVMYQVWSNMNEHYNNYVSEKLKVYHIKCWNKVLSTLREQFFTAGG